jgi:cytochrome b561
MVHVPRRFELIPRELARPAAAPHTAAASMNETGYARTAAGLHWLVAALVAAALFMGWTMTDMAISPQRLKVYNYHKWIGVTVLALAVVRLLWKLRHPVPQLAGGPRWRSLAARAVHALLYLLMFAVPLAGWIYSNAAGYRVVYLGKLPLPNLVERDKELAAAWVQVHGALAMTFAVLAGLHLLAALHHHFIARDDTLRRMLPWRR